MEQFSKTTTLTFALILITLILFTLDRLGTLSHFRKFTAIPFEFAQIPVFVVKNNLLQRFEFLTNLTKIEKENITLTQELAKITAESAKLQQLAKENEALRAQLGLTQTPGFSGEAKIIPAKVVGISRYLVIVPENPKSVKEGATVTFGNNFIGVVTEVGLRLAKVRLISDPASSFPATILTPTGQILGNLVGRFGAGQVLEKVEKQEIVPEGAIVQTAGGEEVISGLVLGKVVRVLQNDPNPFLEIDVASLVDFSKLTTVFVISQTGS